MVNTAKPGRLAKSEKHLLIAVILFVAVIISLTWWWDDINRDPVVNIPEPTMPVPNAYDYYTRVNKAFVWKNATGVPDNIKDGNLPSLDTPGKPSAVTRPPASPPPPTATGYPVLTLKEVEDGIKKNQPALAILRQGFQYEYCDPPCRSTSHRFPHFNEYRDVCRTLIVDGYVKAVNGDWRDATNSYLDGMELGGNCSHGGPMISGLVGIACQALLRQEMWRTIDHLDAPGALAAAKRLQRITTMQTTLAETLEEEKWAGQAGLLELFRLPRKDWLQLLDADLPISSSKASLFFTNKRKVMANYTAYMDALILEAGKPYAIRKPVPLPEDAFSQVLSPVFSKAAAKYAVTETYNHLLLTMLALRAYKLEHGAYPATLADLSPKYLSTVPSDPFAKAGPLRYQRTGKTYLLYSIGPDGKDDGGAPSTDGRRGWKKGSSGNNSIRAHSRGDVVAGINVN